MFYIDHIDTENKLYAVADSDDGAIDLITEKRIQGLEFDRTISATIINADNSKDGEYILQIPDK